MSVVNQVNGDIYTVIKMYDSTHVIINYYNEELLVEIGSVWKLIEC